ncbi:MAG: response regulator [Actinobacteria bacterium]|nr:response regulator [Actinomycetota bacterium]
MGGRRALVAVICEDDRELATALADTVTHLYGMQLAATVTTVAEAVRVAASAKPDLVVIDLALAGDLGLGVVAALHEAAPGCTVVVVVPQAFVGLQPEAVAAGAMTLVESSDLRPLQCCVEHLTGVHGDACPSCADQQRRRESLWWWPD